MRIHSLIIDNVRAVEHLELTDLPDTGVILIHGENEAGKSTILDALDAVLTVKHDSTAAKIRALYPKGRDEQPEVTLAATVGPYTFTVHKRFGKGAKGKAELTITAPRREELTGEQAHNRLGEILAEHVDQELFDALFLRQGAFTETISAAGIPSFTRALEASSDASGSSADSSEAPLDDSGLMQRVEAEFARYFTGKGNDKRVLTDADKAVTEAEDAVREAEANLASYERDVDEFAQSEATMAEIETELPGAEEELAEREKDAAAAKELAGRLDAAKEKAARAAVDVERIEEDLERRTALVARVKEVEAELASVNESLAPARERDRAEAEALAAKEESHTEAREKETTARQRLAEAETSLAVAQAAERLRDLADTVARLDDADAEIARLRKTVPDRPVTDDDVRAVETASNEVALQRRLRDAAAAHVDITAPDGTTITVDGSGHTVGGDPDSIALHDGTELGIGDVTLTYRAAAGTDTASGALRDAEAELERLISALGCADVDEARALRDSHREAAAALTAAIDRRRDILRGRDADEVHHEHARLTELVEESESESLSVDDAQASVDTARAEVEEIARAVHDLALELVQLRTKPEHAKLVALEAQIAGLESTASGARSDLAAASEKHADDALVAARDTAVAASETAAAEAANIAEEVAAADPTQAERLRDGARNRLDNLTKRYYAARDRRLQLESRVTSAEGEGEKLDHARAALEVARVGRDRLRRKANAVKLLREMLVEYRDAARAKYAAPFAQSLQRYASQIFGPGTEFTLDDALSVEARTLDGTTIDLAQLSGGAKEQMALLTRFAIADMVAGAGTDSEEARVPVVVDDALGATDPQRLARMNALFSQVGENSQVFVLTCFPQRFDRVAAARSASIQELKGGR
ncbi:AAA family ATPase [Corynebacterium sp. Marseille-P3884]|uniref:AAA family ATPase n=1 Tax=Corynebacterium sp. Marseille-P3884 TaxID=2495409 RepID=UPI001B33AB2B|nr:AAA family ATPase [Corynebacterium sp. Marseille-P3884]MBP3948985.1 AAA family ATPase [Corynebacterium sp. Marseille-P3884]